LGIVAGRNVVISAVEWGKRGMTLSIPAARNVVIAGVDRGKNKRGAKEPKKEPKADIKSP
jgi:hypothetical protein